MLNSSKRKTETKTKTKTQPNKKLKRCATTAAAAAANNLAPPTDASKFTPSLESPQSKSSASIASPTKNPNSAPSAVIQQSKLSAPPLGNPVKDKPVRVTRYTLVKDMVMELPANCYRVKEEYAATAKTIISKHGDILQNCLFQGTLRVSLLESVCAFYEKLSKMSFSVVTLAELDYVMKEVNDIDRAKVEVGWLTKRLADVYEAKQYAEGASRLEGQRVRSKDNIAKLEKELSLGEEEKAVIKAKLEEKKSQTATLDRTVLKAKEMVFSFCWKSLDYGGSSGEGKFKYPMEEDYKLKEEFESAARVIFSNQGDILAGTMFQGRLRLGLLECACSIYLRLEKLSPSAITLADLETLRRDVDDLERAEVDVSWVSPEGLNSVYEAKKLVENPSLMEQLKNKNQQKLEELEKELNQQEKNIKEINSKLDAERAQTAVIHQKFLEGKEKVLRFRKSLIYGI